jgi:RHS repeat-associated protein
MKQGLVLFSATVFALLCNASAWAATGRTVGQFGVSPTGSAQYTIPIWAPPGPQGMQPNVSLFYDSQAHIGPLGIGWSLAGLGEIARCNQTVAQDGIAAPVALVTSDGYCINGSRLRLTSGTYGMASSTYQTEIADFSNIIASPTSQGNGPAYFTVQGRNGLTYYYGYTDANGNGANSQVIAAGSNPSTALSWLLSKVTDRAGNNYVINYTTFGGTLIGTAVPSTIYWTPTSAGASSYTYTMQFNYTSNVPQSSINKYVGGSLVSNTKLLSSVEIFYSSAVVKDYFLGYTASTSTGREELVSVQECADSAKSNCLLPTSITYEGGTAGVSTTITPGLGGIGALLMARYDLNGDGYPDLVYNPTGNGAWYVAFGSANGYGTPVNTGISGPALVGNVTGGSQDGILGVSGGIWWYYTWNGSTFTGTSTGIAVDSASYGYQLADIDGDGRPDLIDLDIKYNALSHKSNATINTRLNTSTGGTASFSSTVTAAYSVGPIAGAQLQTPDYGWGKLRRYDFNGDGRDDLVLQVITGSGNYNVSTYELLSTGTGFTASVIATVSGATFLPVFFTNWNDDACTDFVTSGTLYVSGCNGSVPTTYPVGNVVAAMDWDGDGRTDLVVANGSTLGVYLSTGSGISSLTTTSIPYTSTCQYVTMDANGDGLDDLGCWSQNGISYYLHNGTTDLATQFKDGYGNSASPTYVSLAQGAYTSNTNAVYPYANVTPSFYAAKQATFSDPSSTSSNYNITYSYYWAWTNLQGRGFSGFDDIGIIDSRTPNLMKVPFYRQDFPYTGMLKGYNLLQKGSDGQFSVSVEKDTYTLASTTLSTTQNQGRVFPHASNIKMQKSEVGGAENGDLITTSSTDYTYDNYGNALTVNTTVTDNDPNSPYPGDTWTTNVTNFPDVDVPANQAADLAAWCLTMLDETQVVYSSMINGTNSVPRTKTFTPDTPSACRIKTIVTEPTANNSLYKVTEALTFDSFGNVQTDTITGANMPSSPASRVTTLNWGTTGQFLQSMFDPSNNTTTPTMQLNYTSNQSLTFGVPDYVLDANTLKTSWGYDAFGRKNNETRPDGTSTTWTWSACNSFCGWSNSVYQIAQTAYQTNGTAIRTDTTSYDSIDRVTQTAGPTLAGATATIQTLYNPMGSVAQRSLPFVSGTPYQQSYHYDVLNRLLESERPVNASSGQTYCDPTTVPPVSGCQGTAYTYAGRTLTVTDAKGNKKTTITDVNGWLRQIKDATGYSITRAYDAAGSLIGITDNAGNTLQSNLSYKYGIRPFLVGATDADLGAWTYTVDSLGERTGWTDAKGQSFSMTYDALSRPVTRTEPDPLTTTWTWGSSASSFNIGKLQSVTAASSVGTYSQAYAYDNKARLSTEQITIPGDSSYTYTLTYNATTGLLDTLQYPVSTAGYLLKLQYGYANGILQSIADFNALTTVFWNANTVNARGQYTQEKLGNNVVVNHALDAVTGWPSSIQAGVGGGAALQNNSYLFDEVGNLTQRQDNNKGLTENVYYDNLYRLDHTTLTNGGTNLQMSYDLTGNVLTWQLDGASVNTENYTTPQAGCSYYANSQPHAARQSVQSIWTTSTCYDANGNVIKSSINGSVVSTINWSSYNQPNLITGGVNSSSQFFYDQNHQRYKQIASYSGSPETTFYVGGLLEKMINSSGTFYRHYIPAGYNTVVYARQLGGTNSTYYLTKDHLGSTAAISDQTGTLVVTENFPAMGAFHRGDNWTGVNTGAEQTAIANVSRHGFTGHEMLDNVYEVNMNGRIYVGHTFLSPDPVIANPSNTQSYNRYAYVNNNPLSFVDPSGFCGYKISFNPGSAATYGTDANGNLIELTPVTPSSHSITVDDSAPCFVPNTPPIIAPVRPPAVNAPAPVPVQSPCPPMALSSHGLNPQVQTMADTLISQLAQQGINARLGQTLRTFAQQDQLYAQGRTAPGRIVTNAQGGQSIHNYGLAFDIQIFDADGTYITNGSDPAYATAGSIGESIGLEWGGNWSSIFDPSHFQYMGGLTLDQIRANFNSGVDPLCHEL